MLTGIIIVYFVVTDVMFATFKLNTEECIVGRYLNAYEVDLDIYLHLI